jgi:hypothetical protein
MIPSAFCWTRIGVESGQSVDAILRRKQVEQRVAGCFVWGIGNGLGDAALALAARGAPKVLFSPIAGAPAPQDAAPTGVVAWRAYLDSRGVARPLPAGVLVTSRAHGPSGKTKPRLYALFCASAHGLRLGEHGSVDITELRNLVSRNPVGSSQTTAIVERGEPRRGPGRAYRVALVADLVAPYHVTLVDPIAITTQTLGALQALADAGEDTGWTSAVRSALRDSATTPERADGALPLTLVTTP